MDFPPASSTSACFSISGFQAGTQQLVKADDVCAVYRLADFTVLESSITAGPAGTLSLLFFSDIRGDTLKCIGFHVLNILWIMEIAVWHQIRINCIFYHLVIDWSERFLRESFPVWNINVKQQSRVIMQAFSEKKYLQKTKTVIFRKEHI